MKKLFVAIIFLLSFGLFVQPYYVNAASDSIIYIDGINGNDESGTGANPSSAIKTLKKAYELLQTGGSIYVVDTISINEEISITDTQYKDKDTTINLQENAKIEKIKRYVQPIAYETLSGYDVESNINNLINVNSNGNLKIENIIIDGHYNEVKNISDKLNAIGITNTKVMINSTGVLNLKNVVLQNNHTNGSGGTIYNSGNLTTSNSEIKDNHANFGGGIYNDGKEAEIINCDFYNNTATKSGGALILVGETSIINSKIYNNNAFSGGAIYVQSNVKILDTDIYKNVSTNSGGAIFTNSGSVLDASNCNIYENEAKVFGGAIYANGELILTKINIYKNKAIDGGAMTTAYELTTVNNCKIYNNEATGNGGAIEAYGPYEIVDSHIYSNAAAGSGGGIWNYGTLTFKNTTIENNTATENGNGIYQTGTLKFDENVNVYNNDIYLCENKKIDVISPLPTDSVYIVTPDKYELGQVLVTISDAMEGSANDIIKNIKLTPKDKYAARPGDLNTSETISDKDIIISQITNTIIFSKKYSNEENLPDPIYVYWQENIELSDIIPEYEGYKFLGWKDENNEIMSEEKIIELLNNSNDEIILFADYEPSNEANNPDTADRINYFIIAWMISLIGLISSMIYVKIE